MTKTTTAANVWRAAKWVPATWLLMLAVQIAPKDEHSDALALRLNEWMRRLKQDI